MESVFFFSIFMFFSSANPFVLSLVLIFFSLNVAVSLSEVTVISWFSYIVVMIYVSGLMVLFSYISSFSAGSFGFKKSFFLGFISIFLVLIFFISFFQFHIFSVGSGFVSFFFWGCV